MLRNILKHPSTRGAIHTEGRLCPDIPHTDLELEILGTSVLDDITNISELVNAGLKFWVTFALGDFGADYSSFTYLKRLPAGVLEIDKGFVIDVLNDPDDLAIVQEHVRSGCCLQSTDDGRGSGNDRALSAVAVAGL